MAIGDGQNLKSPRFAGDEVLEACYNNERILRKGDSGPAVQKIQQALIFLGFPIPGTGVDGIFGVETTLALSSYQEARGLTVDGVIGPETMESLDDEFRVTDSDHYGPEPRVSDVPSPLMPNSPVREARGSPFGHARAPKIPKVRAPRVSDIHAPPVPVPQVPELATQVKPHRPPAKTTTQVPKTTTSHLATHVKQVDSQGRKYHTAGTWSGNNSSFEAKAGKSVLLEVNNLNVHESNIIIKTNSAQVEEATLLPDVSVNFEFSTMDKVPFFWKFHIETDSDDSLIEWKLYSDWVPGDSENP